MPRLGLIGCNSEAAAHSSYDDELERGIGVEAVRRGPGRDEEAGSTSSRQRSGSDAHTKTKHAPRCERVVWRGDRDVGMLTRPAWSQPPVEFAGRETTRAAPRRRMPARRAAATRMMIAVVIARTVSQPSDVVTSNRRYRMQVLEEGKRRRQKRQAACGRRRKRPERQVSTSRRRTQRSAPYAKEQNQARARSREVVQSGTEPDPRATRTSGTASTVRRRR